jgi:hypothetical protein
MNTCAILAPLLLKPPQVPLLIMMSGLIFWIAASVATAAA